MGCNCKSSGNSSSKSSESKPKSIVDNILKYSTKMIGFFIGIVLLPLIIVAIVWFMFDTIVLNKEVDLTIILKKIVKINKVIFEDDLEDEEENELLDDLEDEEIGYITQNVEEIK